MNNEECKELTEWLGECYHMTLMPLDNGYCPKCGKGATWRSFTTWQDLGDCKGRLVEKEEVEKFEGYTSWRFMSTPPNTITYLDWLLNPERFCELVLKYTRREK